MTEIPQEVREAAKWRHGTTCGSHAFSDRACTCGAEAEFHAMFLAGKRAGMKRAAVIADDHARNAWTIGQQEGQNDVCSSGRNHGARAIAQAIRGEASAQTLDQE